MTVVDLFQELLLFFCGDNSLKKIIHFYKPLRQISDKDDDDNDDGDGDDDYDYDDYYYDDKDLGKYKKTIIQKTYYINMILPICGRNMSSY